MRTQRVVTTLALLAASTAVGACSGAIEHGTSSGGGGAGPAAGSPGGTGSAGSGAAGSGGDVPTGPVDSSSCDPSAPATLADVPLRRLTRSQYAHAVRDLLAPALGADAATLATTAAARFPTDDRAGPFPANPTAAISNAHARAFLDAAEQVATAATTAAALPKLLPCTPTGAADAACAEKLVRSFARRAFRRPPSDDAVAGLLDVWRASATAANAFADGARAALEAMLVSPDFLYHVELKPSATGTAPVALDPYEVAARLSFYLWDSIPDDALLAAADAGQLATPDALRKQAERLLADARARDAMDAFATAWLGIDGVETLSRDQKLFPRWNAQTAAASKTESLDYVDAVVRKGDGTLRTLLAGTSSVIPDALLPIYGVSRPLFGDPAKPLDLPKAQRAGVLTQVSVLAATSHMDYTSPVKRGVFLLDDVLCHDIPLPEGLKIPQLPDPDPNQTTRERFAQHEKEPACAVCHKLIDPLGLAMERYDAIGTYRDKEGANAIDDSGAIALGDPQLDGTLHGAVELAGKLVGSKAVGACVTKQVRRFAIGTRERDADACTLARLERRLADTNGNVRELMLAVVTDESFRTRPATP